MRPILEIKEKKKDNCAIFLGCEPSINDLDPDFINISRKSLLKDYIKNSF